MLAFVFVLLAPDSPLAVRTPVSCLLTSQFPSYLACIPRRSPPARRPAIPNIRLAGVNATARREITLLLPTSSPCRRIPSRPRPPPPPPVAFSPYFFYFSIFPTRASRRTLRTDATATVETLQGVRGNCRAFSTGVSTNG